LVVKYAVVWLMALAQVHLNSDQIQCVGQLPVLITMDHCQGRRASDTDFWYVQYCWASVSQRSRLTPSTGPHVGKT